MSYDDIKEVVVPKKFKQLTCQVKNCEYNLGPSCSHDWMELNELGECIFNTTETEPEEETYRNHEWHDIKRHPTSRSSSRADCLACGGRGSYKIGGTIYPCRNCKPPDKSV